MRILLLSMPDAFEHTPTLAVRMPNGGLASLAGNVDPHHDVAIADLVLAQSTVRQTVERLMGEGRNGWVNEEIDLRTETGDQIRRGQEHQAAGCRSEPCGVTGQQDTLTEELAEHLRPRLAGQVAREC